MCPIALSPLDGLLQDIPWGKSISRRLGLDSERVSFPQQLVWCCELWNRVYSVCICLPSLLATRLHANCSMVCEDSLIFDRLFSDCFLSCGCSVLPISSVAIAPWLGGFSLVSGRLWSLSIICSVSSLFYFSELFFNIFYWNILYKSL